MHTEARVDQNVVAVALEAVAVVDDGPLDGLQRVDDDAVDVVEELRGRLAAPRRLDEEADVLQVPLAAVLDVVVVVVLLDGHVRQVDEGVVELARLAAVLDVAEPREARVVLVDLRGKNFKMTSM